MPLQDLPCLGHQGSMLSHRMTKRKSRDCLSEGLDTECTPTELIQQWSPRHKHQRLIGKGKENDSNQFVLARRSRRKKESLSCRKPLFCPPSISCSVLFVAVINSYFALFHIFPSAGISWDHLPDELLLRILFYIPLQDLLRMSVVCKRWHRLA